MSDHATRARVSVITRYDVPSPRQEHLAVALEHAIRDWISKRPGFVCGAVHPGIDQLHIVMYTVWDREDNAINYMDCPEAQGLWDTIMSSGSRLRDSHRYWTGRTIASEPNTSGRT